MKRYLNVIPWFITAGAYATSVATNPAQKVEIKTAPPAENSVYLSHPLHFFEVQFDALLMQPSGNLHYAAEADPLPAPTPNWKIHEINTDYHFGFDAAIKGLIHSTNTNIELNWEHFHSKDSSSTKVASENMIGPFFEIGPDALPYKTAYGRVTFHFNQINLDYGIFINLGRRMKTNLYGGVSGAYIK